MPRGSVRKRRGRYFVDYYVHGKRKREMAGTNRAEAERILNKRMGEVVRGEHPDIFKKPLRFNEYATVYEVQSRSFKRSWNNNGALALKHLVSFFGNRLLTEITPERIEEFRDTSKSDVRITPKGNRRYRSGATVNRELSLLRAILNKAIDNGYLAHNPVKKVKFYDEKQNARERYLSTEEIDALLKECNPRLHKIVVIALNTGMRKGEIQNLRWAEVFYEQGFIKLPQTKNGEIRYVQLNETAKRTLASVPKHPGSSFVFCGATGKPYNFRKAFELAVGKAAIKDFRFHDLRHTYASHMVMAGVDLNTVRELLGHKSMAMTLRYAHLSEPHKAKAVEILAKRIDVGAIWALTSENEDNRNFEKLVSHLNKDNNEKFAGVAQR